ADSAGVARTNEASSARQIRMVVIGLFSTSRPRRQAFADCDGLAAARRVSTLLVRGRFTAKRLRTSRRKECSHGDEEEEKEKEVAEHTSARVTSTPGASFAGPSVSFTPSIRWCASPAPAGTAPAGRRSPRA